MLCSESSFIARNACYCLEFFALGKKFQVLKTLGRTFEVPTMDDLIGNVDVSIGTCWCITQTFNVEAKTVLRSPDIAILCVYP